MRQSITALLLLIAGSVFAQQPDSTKLISLYKTPEQLAVAQVLSYRLAPIHPYSATGMLGSELKERNIGQEPSFILAGLPSVANYSDAGSGNGYSYFRIRGIDQTRINVTLDGVPLNEPEDQGLYFSNFTDLFQSLSYVSMQRGVGNPTRHGTASYGGSILLGSPDFLDTTQRIGFNGGSFGTYRVFGEANLHDKTHRKRAIHVRASQTASDGYREHASNFSQSAFLSTAMSYRQSRLKLIGMYGRQKNKLAWMGVPDSLIRLDRRTNANTERETDDFTSARAQLHHLWTSRDASDHSIESAVYYAYLDGGYTFDGAHYGSTELLGYNFRSHQVGFFSSYIRHFSKRTFWISGINGSLYQRRHLGTDVSAENAELYRNTGYKNELSAFSRISFNMWIFHTTADLQYRHVTFDYKGLARFQRLSWDFLNPKIAFETQISRKATIAYTLGMVSREPTRNDLFAGNDDLPADSLGNVVFTPIHAESVVDHELSFQYRQSKALLIRLNGFYMNFSNEIVFTGQFGQNGLALSNSVDKSFRTGIELTVEGKLGEHFSYVHHSAYCHARFSGDSVSGTPILTPPLLVNQEITYEWKKLRVTVGVRYQDKAFIDFANTQQIDGYATLHARAQYLLNGFTFSVAAYNLTNTRYYSNGYVDFDGTSKYFVQSPLNWSAGIQYRF